MQCDSDGDGDDDDDDEMSELIFIHPTYCTIMMVIGQVISLS